MTPPAMAPVLDPPPPVLAPAPAAMAEALALALELATAAELEDAMAWTMELLRGLSDVVDDLTEVVILAEDDVVAAAEEVVELAADEAPLADAAASSFGFVNRLTRNAPPQVDVPVESPAQAEFW